MQRPPWRETMRPTALPWARAKRSAPARLAGGADEAPRALVADEAEAHLVEVEAATVPEVQRERLRLQAIQRRGALLGREREGGLLGGGHACHGRRRLAGRDVAHGGE